MIDHTRDVKNALTDAAQLVTALNWAEGSKRQPRGLVIRCPSHNERNASCSVRTAKDGTLAFKCFSCDWSGDALTAIALAHNLRLDDADDFREALAIGATIGGHLGLADEIRGGRKAEKREPIARPEPQPEAEYPELAEVEALWRAAGPVAKDGGVVRMLAARGIDPSAADDVGAVRAIRAGQALPPWAMFRGRTWLETGHRVIVRAWDSSGALRSVRAWRAIDGDSPKRLPPAGKRAAGLVQANRLAVAMLRREACPRRLIIVEGEPDFVTWATRAQDAVIGIGSGSWTAEHAASVPIGTEVIVRTHCDPAGDRYAAHVIETLGEQRQVWRLREAA